MGRKLELQDRLEDILGDRPNLEQQSMGRHSLGQEEVDRPERLDMLQVVSMQLPMDTVQQLMGKH